MRATSASLALRLAYALCLSVATANHVLAAIDSGLLLDGLSREVPFPVRLYWSLLTLFDAVAVVLLFARPRVGLAATLVIIVSDVVVNSWVTIFLKMGLTNAYLAQIVFLIFVSATVRTSWHGLPRPSHERATVSTSGG